MHRHTITAAAHLAFALGTLVSHVALAAAPPVFKITEESGEFANERPQETYSMSDGRFTWMDELNQR